MLKRDGTGVVVNSACTPTAGSWTSPYDGLVTTNSSSFDIVCGHYALHGVCLIASSRLQDHLVPLKEAWISGARLWTDAQRESFANDLTRPQV